MSELYRAYASPRSARRRRYSSRSGSATGGGAEGGINPSSVSRGRAMSMSNVATDWRPPSRSAANASGHLRICPQAAARVKDRHQGGSAAQLVSSSRDEFLEQKM